MASKAGKREPTRNRIMMKALTLILLVPLLVPRTANAQDLPAMPVELRAGLVARFAEASDKLLKLAEAIPAEKFSWRPAEGTRSISEVLVHVAQANYFTAGNAGAKPPVDLREDTEKTMTEKGKVIDYLRQSSRHLGDVMRNQPEGGLRKPATMFKQQTSYGNVFLFGATHTHEHLGQLVSYARMSGVTPPWSARQ